MKATPGAATGWPYLYLNRLRVTTIAVVSWLRALDFGIRTFWSLFRVGGIRVPSPDILPTRFTQGSPRTLCSHATRGYGSAYTKFVHELL